MGNKIDGKNLIALLILNDWLIPQSFIESDEDEENIQEISEPDKNED